MTASHASVAEIPNDSVAHNAGVVDQNVEAAPFADRSFDHRFCVVLIGHVAIVRKGCAPACGDQLDCEVCVLAGTLTGDRASQIIDHDPCTATRQFQGMTPTDAMAGPRDHGNLSFKHFAHRYRGSAMVGHVARLGHWRLGGNGGEYHAEYYI